MSKRTGWGCEFDDPIELPDGRQLVTLEDAGKYITKLPRAVHEAAEWQAAEALILVATLRGPTMFARIGIMRALNRHLEREFNPSRKDSHWGTVETDPRSMTRSLTASSACATCSRNEITSEIFRRSILCENKRLRGFSSGTLFKLN